MSVDACPFPRNASPPIEPILVSEDEACALFSVSKPTFRRWVDEGILRPVDLPHNMRRRLYKRSDLEVWVDSLALKP
jgi:excisionase family DNA binding protein